MITLGRRLRLAGGLVAALVAVHLANDMLPQYDLRWLGLVPRDSNRVWAVLTMPWMHRDWSHLLGNSVPLFVLTVLALRRGIGRFWAASGFIILTGGLLLWLVGRVGIHLGASGWVFGLWGLLIADAWYERSPAAVITGLVVLVFYGGMAWGLLPAEGVSVESHIAGLLAGVVFSAWSHRAVKHDR